MPRSSSHTPASRSFVIVVTTGALAFQYFVLIAVQAHLFSDGAFYLYWILDTAGPLDIDWRRYFAHVVTQSLTVVAIHVGVTNVDWLSYLFGVGLYFPALVSVACCGWIVGAEQREWTLFPLLTAVAVTSNASFFAVSESHLLVGLFWPLIFILIFRAEWSWREWVIAAALAMPTLRCYESMTFIGLPLVASAIWRVRKSSRRGEYAGFLALAGYFTAGIMIGLWGIAYPRSPENLGGFLRSTQFLTDDTGNWHVLGLVSILTIVTICVALTSRFVLTPMVSSTRIGVACISLAAAGLPFLRPMSVDPHLHYQARVLNLWGLLGIAAMFFVVLRRRPTREAWHFSLGLIAVLACCQTVWHLAAAREWVHYRDTFRAELAVHDGLVPYQTSLLSRDSDAGHPIRIMNWDWTMPLVSVLMAPGGNVKALIDNPVEPAWQPFAPSDITSLPDLTRYGIRFNEYSESFRKRE